VAKEGLGTGPGFSLGRCCVPKDLPHVHDQRFDFKTVINSLRIVRWSEKEQNTATGPLIGPNEPIEEGEAEGPSHAVGLFKGRLQKSSSHKAQREKKGAAIHADERPPDRVTQKKTWGCYGKWEGSSRIPEEYFLRHVVRTGKGKLFQRSLVVGAKHPWSPTLFKTG